MMKNKILKILKETEGYVSGETLSQSMGVSRTAIWKVISGLKEEGYEIESVTRKGYCLRSDPDLITAEELQYQLNTQYMGRTIYFYPTVDSTNQEAKKLASQGAEEGTVVIAEQQVKGKGRRGRNWVSDPGIGIWMSCILRPVISPIDASLITLITGLAVCKAIRKVTSLTPEIKWPNDIVLNGKKICGILTEMNGEMEQVQYVIPGIGINVNTTEFPVEIQKVATSLRIEGGNSYKRKQIVQEILRQLEKEYNLFLETGTFVSQQREYERLCVTLGKEVKIIKLGAEYRAKALGLNESGELIIQKESGEIIEIRSGEVSVRGIYDYI